MTHSKLAIEFYDNMYNELKMAWKMLDVFACSKGCPEIAKRNVVVFSNTLFYKGSTAWREARRYHAEYMATY